MPKPPAWFLAFAAALLPSGAWAAGTDMSLAEALRLAEASSPALSAGIAAENQAQAAAWGSTAFYYPQVVAAAVERTGLAGSPGLAPDGVAGVISSPFAKGPQVGADVSASWDVLDVARIFASAAAGELSVSASDERRFVRVQVDQDALIRYFDAARAREQAALWRGQVARLRRVTDQVRHYEAVGRYSEVQLLLWKEMLGQSLLEAARADEHLRHILADLGLALGLPGPAPMVPPLDALDERDLEAIAPGPGNPLLAYAQAQWEASRRLATASLAENLPRLYANASLGNVNSTRVVANRNYSASLGVALPVFEGFRNAADLRRARAAARERESLLAAARLRVSQADEGYDDAVALARLNLASLDLRARDARRDLRLARFRYLHLTSPITDLEQALINMVQIELSRSASRAALLTALGARKLFDGGVPAGGS